MKQPPQTFCRNEYNLTGLCNRSSCPLANSQYATILEKEGRPVCTQQCLFRVWLSYRCLLSLHEDYRESSFPKEFVGACEVAQELYEIVGTGVCSWINLFAADVSAAVIRSTRSCSTGQSLLFTRRNSDWQSFIRWLCGCAALSWKSGRSYPYILCVTRTHPSSLSRPKVVGISKKIERREAKREEKAQAAATLDKAIEKELLARLDSVCIKTIQSFAFWQCQSVSIAVLVSIAVQ